MQQDLYVKHKLDFSNVNTNSMVQAMSNLITSMYGKLPTTHFTLILAVMSEQFNRCTTESIMPTAHTKQLRSNIIQHTLS